MNKQNPFTTKVKKFTRHLMENDNISHVSIARRIRSNNTSKIRDLQIGNSVCLRIVTEYYNNYKVWCSNNGLVVEDNVVDAINKLYGNR